MYYDEFLHRSENRVGTFKRSPCILQCKRRAVNALCIVCVYIHRERVLRRRPADRRVTFLLIISFLVFFLPPASLRPGLRSPGRLVGKHESGACARVTGNGLFARRPVSRARDKCTRRRRDDSDTRRRRRTDGAALRRVGGQEGVTRRGRRLSRR